MTQFVIQCVNYRANKVFGLDSVTRGTAQVSAYDLISCTSEIFYPGRKSKNLAFHKINPRKPTRHPLTERLSKTKVVETIKETVLTCPSEFVCKNRGIDVSVAEVNFKILSAPDFCQLTVSLEEDELHGILNGGTSYAVLWEMFIDAILFIEDGKGDETIQAYGMTANNIIEQLKKVFVWVYLWIGFDDKNIIISVAEGLNTSVQVDETSLDNAKGLFEGIRKALDGQSYANKIAYKQGDLGSTSIKEIIQYIELLNLTRYTNKKHPVRVYTSSGASEEDFVGDWRDDSSANAKVYLEQAIENLPEILVISDRIRKLILESPKYKNMGEKKYGTKDKPATRFSAGTTECRFTGDLLDGTVFKGFLFPVIAAMRANLEIINGRWHWRLPIDDLLASGSSCPINNVIQQPINLYKSGIITEKVGKTDAAYQQAYDQMASIIDGMLKDAEISKLKKELAESKK
jgi:hypothetical protein